MNRLIKITMFLIIISATLLASCGPQPTTAPVPTKAAEQAKPTEAAAKPEVKPTEAPKEEAGVKMSIWSRDSDKDLVEGLVKAWNEGHKNKIETTIIPTTDFVTKFGTAVAGGAAPAPHRKFSGPSSYESQPFLLSPYKNNRLLNLQLFQQTHDRSN